MLNLPLPVRVYLCLEPTDMRRSFDGLCRMVREFVGADPLSGDPRPAGGAPGKAFAAVPTAPRVVHYSGVHFLGRGPGVCHPPGNPHFRRRQVCKLARRRIGDGHANDHLRTGVSGVRSVACTWHEYSRRRPE